MKNSFFLVVAAFFAAFITFAAPAAADPPPSHEEAAAQAAACQVREAECDSALETCTAEKAEAEALCPPAAEATETPAAATAPAVKRKVVPVCDETTGAVTVKGPNGPECDCPDPDKRPVVSEKRAFRNFDRLTIVCAYTSLEEFKTRLGQMEATDASTATLIMILQRDLQNMRETGLVDPTEFSNLTLQVEKLEKRVAELERQVREDLCHKDGKNCPSRLAFLMELSLGPVVGGVVRFQDGTTNTLVLGGEVGLTLWPWDRVGFRGTYALGHGENPNSARMVSKGTMGPVFALDSARNHTLAVAASGILEQGVQAAEADFVGVEAHYQARLGSWFYARPSVGYGATRENPYFDEVRQPVGGWTDGVTLFFSAGGVIGGTAPDATSSSSTTVGGSVGTQ